MLFAKHLVTKIKPVRELSKNKNTWHWGQPQEQAFRETLYNVCAVPWGVLRTMGVFSTVGDIMSTVGDILSTVGVFSTVGDIMINVGDILSTMGGVQYCGGYLDARGGYHEYRGGCSVLWGKNLMLFEYPTVLNTPHGTHDIPPHVS